MTRVVYKIGNKTTTSYSQALVLRDNLHLPITVSYNPIDTRALTEEKIAVMGVKHAGARLK